MPTLKDIATSDPNEGVEDSNLLLSNGDDLPSFFPLEIFDNVLFETRTPDEWLRVYINLMFIIIIFK